MGNGFVQVPPQSTGKQVDGASLSVAGQTVIRQRIIIADNASSANYASVVNSALSVQLNGSGTAIVTGSLGLLAGTANIGAVSIGAGTANIGAVSLGAGSSNIGFINNISAPVVLGAGAANIGFINGISATVNVAGTLSIGGNTGNASATVGSTFTLIGGMDGSLGRVALTDASGHFVVTGTVVLAAGAANIGSINNISAAVVLGAGAANIGTINNISAAVAITGNVGFIAGATVDGISKTVNCVVAGQIAAGASITVGNVAVLIGGVDGGGLARNILTDNGGRQVITGNVVLAAGANVIGTVNNISAAVVLGAGAANIGTINNISAAVAITGNVGFIAGATVDGISKTVNCVVAGQIAAGASITAGNVAVLMGGVDGGGLARNVLMDSGGRQVITGNVVLAAGANVIGTVNNISAAVVLGAGAANIGFINGISATVTVTGIVTIGAGANNIGTINNISATAFAIVSGPVAVNASVTAGNSPVLIGGRVMMSASTTATVGSAQNLWLDKSGRLVTIMGNPCLAPSASHGPRTVTISTSASIALIAAGGAGVVAFVTGLTITNGSSTLTRADIYETSATATPVVAQYLAASGGGVAMNFDPPWRVSANTALNARVKPSVSQCLFTIHFYMGQD